MTRTAACIVDVWVVPFSMVPLPHPHKWRARRMRLDSFPGMNFSIEGMPLVVVAWRLTDAAVTPARR